MNHPQHSKSAGRRLTLVMLWILRAPLMVRTVFTGLVLLPFLATSAGAARVDAERHPVHTSAKKSSGHLVHHTTRHSSRATRSGVRPARSAAAKHSPSTSTHRRTQRVSARKGPASVPHRSSLRRTRYTRHAKARFVPIAATAIRPAASRSPERFETDSAPPDASAERVNETLSIDDSGRRPAEADWAQAPAGTETSPASATPDEVAETGNPLAAPLTTDQPSAPPYAQIAELRVPRIYGRYTLRGTHDSLVRQNERAEEESLERIEDDADLQDRISRGLLVRVPESSGLMVNPALPEDRRYCRPWTAAFLSDLSRAYEARFHKPFVVSSAVRTVEYQKRLMRINHNAADAEGDIVSPHLTGATIDIAKSGLSRREMQWMRDHLSAYQTAGVIDVEEEFRQRCFHITVYKNYAPASSVGRPHHTDVPQTAPPDPSTATISDQSGTRDQ